MTVRVPKSLLENAKRYAEANETTLTRLITAYLEKIKLANGVENGPIVERLSGSLSPELSTDDYHSYLEAKYGQPN